MFVDLSLGYHMNEIKELLMTLPYSKLSLS